MPAWPSKTIKTWSKQEVKILTDFLHSTNGRIPVESKVDPVLRAKLPERNIPSIVRKLYRLRQDMNDIPVTWEEPQAGEQKAPDIFIPTNPDPPPVEPPPIDADLLDQFIAKKTDRSETKRIKALEQELADLRKIVSAYSHVSSAPLPPIERYEFKSGLREATAVALLSDAHVEEIVLPGDTPTGNEYNPEIAEISLARFFAGYKWLLEFHRSAFKITSAVLWLGGDLMTGHIHEELVETTATAPIETILWLRPRIVAGIDALLDDPNLEILHIPCSYGNHGRNSVKSYRARGAAHSYEWLFYQWLVHHYEGNPRVRIHAPPAGHQYMKVYDFDLHFTHGDEVNYGGGVGGITIPLNKAVAQWDLSSRCSYYHFGHFHQYIDTGRILVNGCFTGDSRVITVNGPKPITEIRIGDNVLSRDGSVQTVVGVTNKIADCLIRLRAKGLPNVLRVTPNHMIWAIKGESRTDVRLSRGTGEALRTTVLTERPRWIPAEDLSVGDWIHTPGLNGSRFYDEDLLWVYGLFMAEGHTILDGGITKTHNRIEYTMHLKEENVLRRAKEILDKHLGKVGRLWLRPSRTTSQLSYSGRDIAARFREEFGHTAFGKRIPSWMFQLSKKCRQAIVQGWFDGDGTARGQTPSGVTVSPDLAWGIYLLAIGTEFEPLLYVDGVQKVVKKVYKPRWRIAFVRGQDVQWINGERFLRLDLRQRQLETVEVFDLEVSGEHTYCVEGFGVHNSMIGYNAYAMSVKATPEPPQQSFYLLDSTRGKTCKSPIWIRESHKE